jgi:hypothetical protein
MLLNNNALLHRNDLSLSLGSFILDGTVGSFTGLQTRMSYLEEGSIKAYSPRMLWRNGKTYYPYQSFWSSTPGGQAKMLVYDERYGFDRPYIVGNTLAALDAHSVPSLAIDNDNRIHILQEQSHVSAFDYYRAENTEDYNNFSVGTDIGVSAAYAHPIILDNGNYVIYHRALQGGASKVAAKYVSSSGFGGTWTGPTAITDFAAGTDVNRHYVTLPMHHYYNGEYFLLITNRLETEPIPGVVTWHKYYLLITSDFVTFRNYQNTHSSNITLDGTIDVTELDTYYKYWQTDNTSTQGYVPVACVSPQGKFYAAVANGDNNYFLVYYDGGWQSEAITTPNIVAIEDVRDGGLGNDGGIEYIMPFGDFDIIKIAYIDEGTYIKPHIFRTTDRGVTWTDGGDMLETINDDILGVMIPNNFFQMPFYRNFPVYFMADDEAAAGIRVHKVYFKRAAFGAIQAETGTVSAASALTHASGMFHYKMVDADITRSGTNVLTFVDKFGLRNATCTNNPQWDNVDMVTFNGTTNYASISSTGFPALTKYTVMFVARMPATTASIALSFSDNTSNNEYIGLYASSLSGVYSALWQYQNGGSSNLYYGQDVTANGSDHLIAFVCDGRAKVDIYIDGVLQNFNPSTYANFGASLAAITTINAVRIAGIDRSATDVFGALRLKEIVMYSDVLDFETQRSFMKKLCDDYGITYLYQFE